MRYTAIVKDGGLFIPNIMPPMGTTSNIVELEIDLPKSYLKKDFAHSENIANSTKISQTMLNAVGIISSDVDGTEYQNAIRAEWD